MKPAIQHLLFVAAGSFAAVDLFAAADLAARPAAAQAPESAPTDLGLSVRYRAAPGCPSSSKFLHALDEHLAAGGEGAIVVDVSIDRGPGAAGFELRLGLLVAGKEFESRARADACEDLVRLAALDAAMARISAPLGNGEPVSAPSVARNESLECPSPERATTALDTLPAASAPLAPRPSLRWLALAGLSTAGGMLPRWALGQSVALGLGRDAASVRFGATWWQPEHETFSSDGAAPLAIEFEQQSLELAPCWAPAVLPALRLGGCALFAGHRIHTGQKTSMLGTLGVGGIGSFHVWEGLFIEARAALQLAVRRPDFGVGALRFVYEPARVSPLSSLAIGWEFDAGAVP